MASIILLPIRKLVQTVLLILPKNTRLYLGCIDKTIRYRSVLEEIKEEGAILDVGGGSEGIALFTDRDVTILDISADELKKAERSGHKTVLADGADMPVKDNQYDYVVSVASLEHVTPEKRDKYISELKRIAKKAVILYVPFGKDAEDFDRDLLGFRRFLGIREDWAEEHVKYGLPTLGYLRDHFPDAKIKKIQNIPLWRRLMKIQALPIINLFLPGIYYHLNRSKEGKGPFYACVVSWDKR